MTTVNLEANGFKVRLTYAADGTLETAINAETNEYLMIFRAYDGVGLTFTKKTTITAGTINLCDARYALLEDIGVHVPYYLFIQNPKP